jgi:methyl-accepting chemotaxis protein
MLEKLVPDIQRTAELVQEIAAASKEQDTGAQQINTALVQLEKVIQQNASASEEMAATTEQLSSQSEQLVSVLSFFRTEGGAQAPVQRTPAPRTASYAHATPRSKPAKPNGYAEPPATAALVGAGVHLKLKEKTDDVDKEFERY